MSNDKQFRPKPVYTISSAAQTKAYLHHVRMRIVSLLAAQPMTISQVAQEFAVHPANITHHFKQLEKAGLIKLVERRDIGRTTEKYYRAIALHFNVTAQKKKISGSNALALSLLRDDVSLAIGQLTGDDSEPLTCLLKNAKISPNLTFRRPIGHRSALPRPASLRSRRPAVGRRTWCPGLSWGASNGLSSGWCPKLRGNESLAVVSGSNGRTNSGQRRVNRGFVKDRDELLLLL